MRSLIPMERIEQRIYLIRGEKVMLDSELSELYFQLTSNEYASLRCQIGTLKRGQHSKYLPRFFTEQGVAMLSSVLRSPRAVQVNIAIMRAFVRLRRLLASNRGLARRLDALEKKYDGQFHQVFDAIRELMDGPAEPKRQIGFRTEEPCP